MIIKYEAHITFRSDLAIKDLESMGARHGFHHSMITGWDEIGAGLNHFYTKNDYDYPALLQETLEWADQLEHNSAFTVRRIKVELCLYDDRK